MVSLVQPVVRPEDRVIFAGPLPSVSPVLDQDHFDTLRLAGTLEEKRKHIFLRVLAETGNLKIACQSAGYRNTAVVNRSRKADANFEEAFQEAVAAAADMIESEAVRRAVQGISTPVWYKGEICGYEIKFSDSLLQTLLKAAKPEKYADRSRSEVSVVGKIGVAIIPGVVKSVASWEAQSRLVHAEQKLLEAPIQDAEFVEVKDGPVTMSRG